MKHLLILTIALSFGASAEFTAEDKKFCKNLSEAAKQTMELRQKGVAMHKLVEIAESDLHMMLIESAYKKQRMSAESNQKKVTDDFANEWYMVCYEARRETNEPTN